MRFLGVLAIAAFITLNCSPVRSFPYQDPRTPVERRVEDLIGRMTSVEKQDLLRGGGVERLGIPAIRISPSHADSGRVLAATWDPELASEEARASAQAALAKGYGEVSAPDVADYGEDPFLASRMTVAYVGAVQGEGAIATLRNFGVEAQADERAVREIGYPPFRAAIEEAGLWSVALGGGNHGRLTDVLEKDWGFKGFITGGTDAGQAVDDDEVHRMLRAMFASGLFEHEAPAKSIDPKNIAYDIAAKSIVLLKNDAALLPLEPGRVRSIAAIGLANGIRERAATRFEVKYASGDSVGEAVDLARRSDAAIVFGTLASSEGNLIGLIARANPRTIVVTAAATAGTNTGLGTWVDQVPAILYTWESSPAVAQVLFGDTSPSGRLPVTIPRTSTPPGHGLYTGYRYFDQRNIAPLFPFGYGLSYTTFGYSDLRIMPATPRYGQLIEVYVRVRNTGARAGAEVVQLYIHQLRASVDRPPKELKAFRRVELNAGETKEVSFELDRRALWFYDPSVNDWAVEPGVFEVLIGSSSRDIRLRGSFELFQ